MKYYWLKPREKWGDYGDVLFHGIFRFAKHPDVPNALIPQIAICAPILNVLLPEGLIVVKENIIHSLNAAGFHIQSAQVFVEAMIDIPIEKWLQNDKPRYPPGGEPEDYFRMYPPVDDFVPGTNNGYSLLVPDGVVRVAEQPNESYSQPNAPALLSAFPEQGNLFLGKVHDRSLYGPCFCSEPLARHIESIDQQNFSLVEVSPK